jgi:hypothetical protein
MTIGPAPMMRIDLISWRFGMIVFPLFSARKAGRVWEITGRVAQLKVFSG